MKRIVLVGGGGHCKVVIESLKELNIYDEILITDPDLPAGTEIMDCKVVGDDSLLQTLYNDGVTDAFVTVGSIKTTKIRRRIAEKVQAIGFFEPVIIDATAVVAASAHIGSGTYIGKKSVVNADCVIGDHSIINTASVMEHESCCGEFCHVSIGAICCGNVKLGNDVFVGANSTIIQGISVVDNTVVGAGVVVRKKIEKARVVI